MPRRIENTYMNSKCPRKLPWRKRHTDACGKLRPAEYVRKYLLAQFARPEMETGSRLPTIRELANRLQVSVPTVQGTFRRLAAEGWIRTAIGNGTFLISKGKCQHRELRIALSCPLPGDSLGARWGRQICAGIMDAAFQADRGVKLIPLSPTASNPGRVTERLLAERAEVDGLIAFPMTLNEEVRQTYESEGKPVVDLNPPSAMGCANFVSPDYFQVSLRLGKAWRETGRKRIVLMRNWPLAESISSQLRLAGLVNGLGDELGNSITCRLIGADSPAEDPRDQIRNVLNQLLALPEQAPDAIYCVNDVMALTVVAELIARGVEVPRDISVVGGTGLDLQETACPALTRTRQPLEKIGEELLRLLCERIVRQGESLPARIIATNFIGGATTRKEENDLLNLGGTTEKEEGSV